MNNLIEQASVIEIFDRMINNYRAKVYERMGADTIQLATPTDVVDVVEGILCSMKQCVLDIPPAQQPTISAIKYGGIKQRICKQYRSAPCKDCPLYISNTNYSLPTPHTVAIVEKWVREYPED